MGYAKLPWHEQRRVRVLLEDGRRVEGWLEAWREERDEWRGWVRYSTGPAETRVWWFPEDRVMALR
jgi:hypothetical protein